MFKYLLPLFIFTGLVILFVFGLKNDPRVVPSPFIDKPLPSISLPVLGQPDNIKPIDALKGRVFLVNIWATWCPPCREEHPILVNLAREQNISFVGLNLKDDEASALKWLTDLGNPYELNLADKEGLAVIDLGVYGAPETFIVDKHGIIKYKHIGPLTDQVVNEIVLPLVSELNQ